MKCHFHGGVNSYNPSSLDLFFNKLLNIMEMAAKQLFTLVDIFGSNDVNTTSMTRDDDIGSSMTSRLHEV